MSITISSTTPASTAIPVAPRDNGRRPADKAQDDAGVKSDTVTLSGPAQAPLTYGNPRASAVEAKPDLNAMLEESDRQAQQVINLILPAVEQQGLNLAKVVSGEQKLNADPATIEAAKAAIADDGEFGVAQVSERILNFAKGVIGDDPSRLATMRAAVQQGFDEAAKMLGGTLPEISQKTQSAVMATFDRWEKDGMNAAPDASTGNTVA